MILILSDRTARADFGPASAAEPIFSWQSERLAGQTIVHSAEAALAAGPRCGKNVWVLCEDLWTQTLTLAAPAVAGLSEQHLRLVLAFELESLSGLAAGDAQLGYTACARDADEATFWVTQIPKSDHQQIQQAIQSAGGRMRGICHPAGLPGPSRRDAEPGSWSRIEAWGDITVGLSCTPPAQPGATVFGGSPGQRNWRQGVEQWLDAQQAAGPVELLYRWRVPSDDLFEGLTGLYRLDALEGPGLDVYLKRWADALAAGPAAVPMIRPAARQLSRAVYVAASIVLLAATVAACVAGGMWMENRTADLRAQAVRVDRPRKDAAVLDKRISGLERELRKLQPRLPTRVAARPVRDIAAERRRVASLLDALSDLAGDDRVITQMSAGPGGTVTVEGLCTNPASADSLAVGLGQKLDGEWLVRGAQKTAMLSAPDGGPWDFTIRLAPPKPLAGQTSAATPKSTTAVRTAARAAR